MADLRGPCKVNNPGLMTTKASALRQQSVRLGEAVYAQSQGSPGAESPPGNENVVDAEFTEIEDEDKKKSA